MGASCRKAMKFIDVLSKEHEDAGMKAEEEDLLMLLLWSNAQLMEADAGREGRGKRLDDATDMLVLGLAPEWKRMPEGAPPPLP